VANEFTSILTGGLSDNTVKTMYDFAFGLVYFEVPTYRTWVDKRPAEVNGPGQSVVLNKQDWLGDAAVTAMKTPLNEESDVDSTALPATVPVTLTVNEYGGAVTRSKKLRYFSFADVDQVAARSVAQVAARVLDSLVQDVLVTGSNVIRASARSTTGAVTSTDYLVASDFRKAVTKLRNSNVPDWGGYYAAGVHPNVIHDLREETGSGSWRVPSEYGTDQGNIWRGEFGEFEGLRFVQNNLTRTADDGDSSETVYRTFVQGREAVAERVVEEPNTVISPVTDKLMRFRTIGWYGITGFALYRDESLVRLESASSMTDI